MRPDGLGHFLPNTRGDCSGRARGLIASVCAPDATRPAELLPGAFLEAARVRRSFGTQAEECAQYRGLSKDLLM